MTQQRGLFRRVAASQTTVVVAAVVFATICAQGQESPASLVSGCPAADEQAVLAESPPANTLDSTPGRSAAGIGLTSALIQGIQRASFPELRDADIRMRTFHSQSDYFRTRFSLARFLLLMRMRYFIEVNPALRPDQAPFDGVCAITAHELVHVVSLSRGSRIRRFGLLRLLSKRRTVRFERLADLDAIHRGYGDGLKSYRVWVYAHVPPDKLPEKLRNYFSPEEIAAIEVKLQEQPDLFVYWQKHVPANLQEIQGSTKP